MQRAGTELTCVLFAALAVQATVYRCLPGGELEVLQVFVDSNVRGAALQPPCKLPHPACPCAVEPEQR